MMIEEQLLILKNAEEIGYKLAAFDKIKDVKSADLNKAWNKVRKVKAKRNGKFDCFERVEVLLDKPIELKRAIVTVVSPGFEQYLLILLRGLKEIGNNVPIVIFTINESYNVFKDMENIIAIPCISHEKIDASIKGVIYSCRRWVKADHIIALESDLFTIESLDELWKILDENNDDTMGAVRPMVHLDRIRSIEEVLNHERGENNSISWLNKGDFLLNGGIIIGNKSGWEAIDKKLTSLGARAKIFLDGGMWESYKDEILLNWAMNYCKNYIILHPSWNTSFYSNNIEDWIQINYINNEPIFTTHNQSVKIFHFLNKSRSGHNSVMRRIHKMLSLKTSYIYCRKCNYKSVTKGCSCWTAGTYKEEIGLKTAICRLCSADDIDADIKVEIEEGRK